MFFNFIKEINRLRKEINSLLSTGMSNIYLKVTIEEKNWRSQNFNYLRLKNLSPSQFWGAPTYESIIEFENFLLLVKNQRSGTKTVCGFSIILILKDIMTF